MPAPACLPANPRAAVALAIVTSLTAGVVTRAHAVPLFARQTGQTCADRKSVV